MPVIGLASRAAQSLRDLDTSLRELDSRLIVLQGNPKDELPRIFGEWDVQRLAYEMDIEPYAKSRDSEINQLAAQANDTFNRTGTLEAGVQELHDGLVQMNANWKENTSISEECLAGDVYYAD